MNQRKVKEKDENHSFPVKESREFKDIALTPDNEENSLSKWEPERTVNFEMATVHLLGIWNDQKGRIYLGASLEDQSRTFNTMVVFSPEGKELGRVKLCVQRMPTRPKEILT